MKLLLCISAALMLSGCASQELRSGQLAIHLLAGDCVEVAQYHSGSPQWRAVEVYCNAIERGTEWRVQFAIIKHADGGELDAAKE